MTKNAPLYGRRLTVGYNLTGQEFFDTIRPYKKDIEEFFFSFTHRMPQFPLNYEDVYGSLEGTCQYGIPANLLLNMEKDNDTWEKQVRDAMKITTLQSVSVMSEEIGREIIKKYPQLKIHISTHGVDNLDPDNLDATIIDTVNIDEPTMYESQRLIDACLDAGIKLKFIVNRDCMIGRNLTLSQFAGKIVECCQGTHAPCLQAREVRPWLSLATTAMYKEQIPYSYASYLKLSTREIDNNSVNELLDYWTNDKPTRNVGFNIPLTDKSYPIFLEWIQLRRSCSGQCFICRKCKDIYERIQKANKEDSIQKERLLSEAFHEERTRYDNAYRIMVTEASESVS